MNFLLCFLSIISVSVRVLLPLFCVDSPKERQERRIKPKRYCHRSSGAKLAHANFADKHIILYFIFVFDISSRWFREWFVSTIQTFYVKIARKTFFVEAWIRPLSRSTEIEISLKSSLSEAWEALCPSSAPHQLHVDQLSSQNKLTLNQQFKLTIWITLTKLQQPTSIDCQVQTKNRCEFQAATRKKSQNCFLAKLNSLKAA